MHTGKTKRPEWEKRAISEIEWCTVKVVALVGIVVAILIKCFPDVWRGVTGLVLVGGMVWLKSMLVSAYRRGVRDGRIQPDEDIEKAEANHLTNRFERTSDR